MMVHRCECLLFTSELCLPYLAFCFDPSECFQDLCIWSRAMGNKSSKLQYVSQIVTAVHFGWLVSWQLGAFTKESYSSDWCMHRRLKMGQIIFINLTKYRPSITGHLSTVPNI